MKPATLTVLVLLAAGASSAAEKEERRLEACREVVQEVVGVPEGIPRDLIDKAACVAVIPSTKKFALGLGGRYGKGAVVCRGRRGLGSWGPPLMISIGGGSFGAQIGGQATDYVLVVMNPKGMEHLLKSKFTLGADASVAAGPKGRTAEAATDATMKAEILAYSRARGLFVGISLEGAVVKQDRDGSRKVYGEEVTARELLFEGGPIVPPAGKGLVDALNALSPRRVTGP